MSFARETIVIGGRTTSAHVDGLDSADRVKFAPATHKGVCLAIPGVDAGITFEYAGLMWKVLKAWDDAVDALPGSGSRARKKSTLSDDEIAYYQNRKGKFIDLLLIQV